MQTMLVTWLFLMDHLFVFTNQSSRSEEVVTYLRWLEWVLIGDDDVYYEGATIVGRVWLYKSSKSRKAMRSCHTRLTFNLMHLRLEEDSSDDHAL